MNTLVVKMILCNRWDWEEKGVWVIVNRFYRQNSRRRFIKNSFIAGGVYEIR